jgi:hypothetical protein
MSGHRGFIFMLMLVPVAITGLVYASVVSVEHTIYQHKVQQAARRAIGLPPRRSKLMRDLRATAVSRRKTNPNPAWMARTLSSIRCEDFDDLVNRTIPDPDDESHRHQCPRSSLKPPSTAAVLQGCQGDQRAVPAADPDPQLPQEGVGAGAGVDQTPSWVKEREAQRKRPIIIKPNGDQPLVLQVHALVIRRTRSMAAMIRRCASVNGRNGEKPIHAHEIELTGPSKIIHSPDKPLKCGARVWIETHHPVKAK